jgi:VanZ family protein
MLKKNIFSISIALVILYLSLASSDNFDTVQIDLPWFDKIVHFGMYFTLTSTILFENRTSMNTKGRIFLAALIPFLYGILIEALQMLTISRSGSIADALADLAGILVSIFIWLLVRPAAVKRSD